MKNKKRVKATTVSATIQKQVNVSPEKKNTSEINDAPIKSSKEIYKKQKDGQDAIKQPGETCREIYEVRQLEITPKHPVEVKPQNKQETIQPAPKMCGQEPRDYTIEQLSKIVTSNSNGGSEGMLPLHVTTAIDDIEKVRKYFDRDATTGQSICDPNGRCLNDGSTPLHLAIRSKQVAIVKYLLENGADCCLTDYIGDNALISAIKAGDANIINVIWSFRNNLNIDHANVLGMTALHYGAERKWECLTNFLLQNKADTNCQSTVGLTPLMLAATRGDLKTVELLLKAGADILMEDHDGNTCICKSFMENKKEITRFLLYNIPEDKRDTFIRARLELVLNPPNPEDERKLLETSYLPVLDECTNLPEFRNAFYSQRAIHKLTVKMEDHMHNLEIAMFAAQLVFAIMFKFGEEIDTKFVKQYLSCKGPDLTIHMVKFYTEVWKMSERSTIVAFLPMIGLCEIPEGRSWLKKNYVSVSEYINFFVKDNLKQYIAPNPEIHWCLECQHFKKILYVWHHFHDIMNDIQTEQREKHMLELLEDEEREKARQIKKKEKKKQKRQEKQKQNNDEDFGEHNHLSSFKEVIEAAGFIPCTNDNASGENELINTKKGEKRSAMASHIQPQNQTAHDFIEKLLPYNMDVDKQQRFVGMSANADQWTKVQPKRHINKEKERTTVDRFELENVTKKQIDRTRTRSKKQFEQFQQKTIQKQQSNPVLTGMSTRWADIAKGKVRKIEILEDELDTKTVQEEHLPLLSPQKVTFVDNDFPSLNMPAKAYAQVMKMPQKVSSQEIDNAKRSGKYTFHFHEQHGEYCEELDYEPASSQPHDELIDYEQPLDFQDETCVQDQSILSDQLDLKQSNDNAYDDNNTIDESKQSFTIDTESCNLRGQHTASMGNIRMEHTSKLIDTSRNVYVQSDVSSSAIKEHDIHGYLGSKLNVEINQMYENAYNTGSETTFEYEEHMKTANVSVNATGQMDEPVHDDESKRFQTEKYLYKKTEIAYVGPDECQVDVQTIIKHQNKTFAKFERDVLSQRLDDPFIELPMQSQENPVDALFETSEEIPSWFNDSEQPDVEQYWTETDRFASALNNEIKNKTKDAMSNEHGFPNEYASNQHLSEDLVSTDPAIIGYSNMQCFVQQQPFSAQYNDVEINEHVHENVIRTSPESRFLGTVIAKDTSLCKRENQHEFERTIGKYAERKTFDSELVPDTESLEKQTAIIKPIQSKAKQSYTVINSAFGQSLLENACRLEREHAGDDDSFLYPDDLNGEPIEEEKDMQYTTRREINDSVYFPSFHSDTKLSSDFDERDVSIFHRMQQIQLQQINNYYNQYSKQITNNMSMHQNNFMYYASCAGMSKQQVEQYFLSNEQQPQEITPNKIRRPRDAVSPSPGEQPVVINEQNPPEFKTNMNLLPCIQNLTNGVNIPAEAMTQINVPTTPSTFESLGVPNPPINVEIPIPNNQNAPSQLGYVQPHLYPANIHMIKATQAAMAASVMNQIKEMYKSMLKAKMKSVRWKNELWQLRNLHTDRQILIDKIVIPKEENNRFYLSRHSSGPIVLGFLTDGSEVAVKIIDWKTREFTVDELQHLVDMDVSKYFMNKYKTFCSQDGFYYVAMELYEYTLTEYLQKLYEDEGVTESVAYNKLVWQFMRGLASLHQHCLMVHGELRPDNVVIDTEGNVRITGYGLSRNTNRDALFLDYSDEDKCWLSPEVLVHRQKLTFKSDIWVAGMLMYYILSGGKNPFGAETEGIVWNISQQTYAMDYISEEAGHLLSIMLSVNKTERPCISDALRHPYFWSEEKRLRFVLIAGSDVLRDLKSGFPIDGSGRNNDSMISIIGSMPCNIKIISWMPEIESVVMREMKAFRQYKNNVVELVLFVYNCCLHFEKMSKTAMAIIDEPCKYFLSKFPTLFMTVYRAIKMTNRTERTCYKPFF